MPERSRPISPGATQFDLVGNSAAIFLSPGNHEEQEGWNFDDSPSQSLLSINAQKKFYLNPIPDSFYSGNTDTLAAIDGDHFREDYYAWTWGDALFVVFDPFQYTMQIPYNPSTGPGEESDEGMPSNDRWTWTLGEEQFNRLEDHPRKQFRPSTSSCLPITWSAVRMTYVRGGANPAHML